MFLKSCLWPGSIVIALLTFAAYSSALHGGFIWDDDAYITQNPVLTGVHSVWRIWTTTQSPQYYPLVFTTFWVERHLWGLNPMGYHIANVSLHAMNAILLFWLLRRLEVPGAWMIAAIFAVHPVHVESVAWIAERKNVLSGLFYLLCIGCYLRFESTRRWRWYAAAFGLFMLALFSKTVVATLPVALFLIRYMKGWRLRSREVLELLPFLIFGAGLAFVTKWYEAHVVGAVGSEWNLSIGQRFLVAGRALDFYVWKIVWPAKLIFNYPRWQVDIRDSIQWIWVLGAVMFAILFWWKRDSWSRGPFIGFAYFAASLTPALGFFDVYPMRYSFVADHFQYLASIGIIAAIVGSTAYGFDRWAEINAGSVRVLIWIKSGAGFSVLAVLAILSWKQGLIYRDLETLWQDTINKNPASSLAHNNLGTVYDKEGRAEQAVQEYLTVLRLQPDHVDAHYNLGAAYGKEGRLNEAIQEYLIVLRLKPDYVDAHYNLGNAYGKEGHLNEALQEYLKVLTLQPNYINAHYNIGNVYLSQARVEEAVQEYLNVLRLQPNHIAHYNLGIAYARQGHLDKARVQFEMALRLQPDLIPAQKALEAIGHSTH
jgi:tetratricopeptide (TPR) repeat protein